MRRAHTEWLLGAVLGLTSIAAALPVAMRVEIEPVRPIGADTAVVVVVQIAPEDRARVGDRALVQAELRRAGTLVERIARTATVDADGETRLDVAWPPGEYELRIDIEGSGRAASGVWIGRISIPRLEAPRAPEPVPPAPPADTPPPSTETAAATAPPVAAAAAPPERAPEPEPSPPTPQGAGAAAPSTVASAWGDPGPGLTDLTVMVTERNRPVLGLGSDQFQVRIDGREIAVTEIGDAGSAPLSLGIAVDLSGSMDTYLPDVSQQLGRLALRAAGGEGELLLATTDPEPRIAIDWGASPSQLAESLMQAGGPQGGDLAGLVVTSVQAFEGRGGRRVLIVVTDGAATADRPAWQAAADAVGAAGVPVIVVAFRGAQLAERTRRSLEQLAASSGGKSYVLPDTGMLEMTLEYLVELIQGSYVLRFEGSGGGAPRKVRVDVDDKGFVVLHPKTLR